MIEVSKEPLRARLTNFFHDFICKRLAIFLLLQEFLSFYMLKIYNFYDFLAFNWYTKIWTKF